ncbi:ATP-grasp ribosomal peptide maturase [Kitasatospora sp. NBC_00315]|uniref:ATP-grasp ribosomal peptide maturase n=1 Tax=Kitasatospora sp. NBC_00315 TaxID=2975963 RepID=UPI003255C418
MSGDQRRAVLVLTNTYDATADTVLRILAERRVPVVRVDPGADLYDGASLTARYGRSSRRGTLRTSSREIDLSNIRSVWMRRPSPYEAPPGITGHDAKFAGAQAFWGTGGVLASLTEAQYVNHPWRVRNAEYKPAQLTAAQLSGFLVPDTVITTDPREAREFCADQPTGAVYKPLWDSRYRDPAGAARQVWVREVGPQDITDAVAACPHLFQAKVPKAFDVRLTVVGERQFAARIDGPELDWRRRQDLLAYEPVAVPASVTAAVTSYLTTLDLVFGAFDFAVTESGEWYFLECNPNGQWAWLPPVLSGPIALALADRLQRGPDA